MKTVTKTHTAFEEDVYLGLSSYPKFLYSKYIYDKKGDRLFQKIMALPEYYLTDCEYNILEKHTAEIAGIFDQGKDGFDLIELGAGDGKKTKVLLRHLVKEKYDFSYIPIDISQNAINGLVETLSEEIPELEVSGEKGEYFKVLERLKSFDSRKKIIMLLGSSIGNLLHPRAIDFLERLNDTLTEGDFLFMGFDQKKHPQTILDAYNDPTGITEAFNKNLLTRINRELEGNFDLDKFMHWEVYDPESGTAKSYLVSKEAQYVHVKNLNLKVTFKKWETIHTEISQKYDDEVVEWLVEEAGLKIVSSFSDEKNYYKNYVFTKK